MLESKQTDGDVIVMLPLE